MIPDEWFSVDMGKEPTHVIGTRSRCHRRNTHASQCLDNAAPEPTQDASAPTMIRMHPQTFQMPNRHEDMRRDDLTVILNHDDFRIHRIEFRPHISRFRIRESVPFVCGERTDSHH